jgi:hypothetical protein
MRLDVRLPIGWMLSLIGGILVAFGALSEPAIYARSGGLNVNLWWGLVLLVVGVVLVLGARRRSRRAGGDAAPPDVTNG